MGWTCCQCWCRWRDCSLRWPLPSERSFAVLPQAYTERSCCCDLARFVTPVKSKSVSETAQQFEESEGKYCGLLVVERWSRTVFNIPAQNKMWKSVCDWESVRVCVYSESTHKANAPFNFMWMEMWLRGIDVQFVQWDILSQGLKSGLVCVFFFCQDVLMFRQLNNQQYKLFKRIVLIQSCPGHCWNSKLTVLSHGIQFFFTQVRMNQSCDYWIWIILQKLLKQISIFLSIINPWNK